MTNPIRSSCPKCGAPIPENAPQGLCPKCVLAGAATVPQPQSSPAGRTPAPSIAELAPHFPELEILEVIGVGGMGAVYKARQPKLDRLVALKILSSDLSKDPAFAERFNREARVLARLNHPNIVTVFDFGTAGPFCFLLMEYVDGVNLRQAMRAGGFTPTESLSLVQDICTALKFAHEAGILHRDIKPENVLIDSRGRVKIADFGIAKLVGKDGRDDATLTMHGAVLGTPHYMAPEQIETPGEVDQRADIYSLGVVFYELLTRELPIGRFAPPSERSPMDRRIDEIVMRALEKDRKARYQTAEEVRTSVGALAQSPSAPTPPPAPQKTDERPAAKFSLTTAILTGISLVLAALVAILVGVIHPGVATGPAEQKKLHLMFASILLFIGLPAAISAVTGFIFGTRALGEIRRSGGVKSGLGNAIFATTAWPIVFVFMFSLSVLAHGAGLQEIMVLLLTNSGGAWLLIRGLYRWVHGVTREDGTRSHPGLGRPILMALLVAIGVPILIMIGLHLFGGAPNERLRPHAASPREISNQHSDSNGEVRWRLGKPELAWNITVESGMNAKLQLLLKDEDGSTRNFLLGDCASQINGSPGHGRLELGTVLITGTEPVSATHAMTASFQSGRHRKLIRSSEDLRGFHFMDSLKGKLVLDGVGSQVIRLATRFADGKELVTGTLSLEAVVTLKGIDEK